MQRFAHATRGPRHSVAILGNVASEPVAQLARRRLWERGRTIAAPHLKYRGQYEKASIPVAVGSQSLSCLIYVATVETLARGVPMASGDWLPDGR